MHTEEEAKKKWCPMARMVAVEREAGGLWLLNRTSFNRTTESGNSINPAGSYCIASECMMWKKDLKNCRIFVRNTFDKDDACICGFQRESHPIEPTGYCGLTK